MFPPPRSVVQVCQDVGWPLATDSTPITIGGGINTDSVADQIDGLVDEVQLYDVQLTPEEVAKLAAP